MTNLPVGITKLKKLESLDVSGCALSFLPSQLWRLAALRHLRLNGTGLLVQLAHTWEPLTKLPALESLELRWVPHRCVLYLCLQTLVIIEGCACSSPVSA